MDFTTLILIFCVCFCWFGCEFDTKINLHLDCFSITFSYLWISAAKKPGPDFEFLGPSISSLFPRRTHGIGMISYIHEKQKQNTHKETTALFEKSSENYGPRESIFFVFKAVQYRVPVWVRLKSKKGSQLSSSTFQRNIFPWENQWHQVTCIGWYWYTSAASHITPWVHQVTKTIFTRSVFFFRGHCGSQFKVSIWHQLFWDKHPASNKQKFEMHIIREFWGGSDVTSSSTLRRFLASKFCH